jgi:ABC-type multidrug transport system ATPase subunit
MKDDEPSLEAHSVLKTFGPVPVLRGLSLSCGAGECVLLLGANGAGKSTLLRVLAGLSRVDQGRVVNSFPGHVGFLSHHLFVYGRLTVRENLTLFAKLSGRTDVAGIMSLWGLDVCAEAAVSDLSRGNQSRVALARAFMSEPSVLLLDEPSSHLDDRGIELLVDGIERTRVALSGRSLAVIATHDIHRLGALATRVVVLARGQVVADSGPSAAPAQIQHVMDLYRESNR